MANIVAYFDMDLTVLRASSGLLYMRYLWRQGQTNWRAMLRSYQYAALYKLGLFNYPAMMAKMASAISQDSEAEMRAFCQRWFEDMVVEYIAPKAVQRMNEHLSLIHISEPTRPY